MWAVLADNMIRFDPEYFQDFWTVPGYLGYDAPESLTQARVQLKTTVTEVIYAEKAKGLGLPMPMAMPRGTTNELPVGLRVAEMPEGHALGST